MIKKLDIPFIKSEMDKIKNFFAVGDYEKVILKTKVLLKKDASQPVFYNYLGVSYRQLNKLDDAERILKTGLKIFPKASNMLNNLGIVYRIGGRYTEAESIFKHVLELNSKDYLALFNYGNLLRDLNKLDEAVEFYNAANDLNPNNETILISLAATYQIMGDFNKSKETLDQYNSIFPKNVVADKMYSSIHKYKENDEHQKSMLSKLNDSAQSVGNKAILNFAIAKSFEDQKNFKTSSQYLLEGNSLRFSLFKNYNFENDTRILKDMKKFFSDFQFNSIESLLKPNLIFILGLPRSGTTLLHQIISAHSAVFGAGELSILNNEFNKMIFENNFIKKILSNEKNDVMFREQLASDILKKFKEYNQNLIILDKAPLNFVWIGLIKILFPNSKIIHSKRNLKDTALSIYKNYFEGSSFPWSYNQDLLIRFINLYKETMLFWHHKIPNFIYDCEYEKLVSDPKNEIKSLIKFCNLDWEESCLDHTKNKTGIKTVSIEQARQPIYKKSVNSSEFYFDFLEFLKKI